MQAQNSNSIRKKYSKFPATILPNRPSSEGNICFILYANKLSLNKLLAFQEKCGENFKLLDCWQLFENQVVLLKGKWLTEWVEYAHQLELDIAKLDFSASLKKGGLLVMDMDSTIIEMECIDEIAKLAGTGELVSAITDRAMKGELDFEQSLRHRVSTLKNQPESLLQQVRENLPLMSGLKETVQHLQQYGWKIAIASGGFTYFADYLKSLLNLDYAVSNQFEIIDSILTGNVLGDVVDAAYKAQTLLKLAEQFNIPIEHTVAIGDGANDLTMMKVANLGVAFHAKPKVQQQAQVMINFANFTALLCILSANDRIAKE
ncbi:phosphoserine phosphatase [Seminibacterium arietis]|uniref:Phosphoserine phosphatase n=1 Tax=Seminibacterium arietis TaxID=1173502 RepID=A0ABW3IAB6_9PAST